MLCCCVLETNDLIYEGIATINTLSVCIYTSVVETNDLIYEGIATPTELFLLLLFLFLPETNDLIYEGIATLFHVFQSSTLSKAI